MIVMISGVRPADSGVPPAKEARGLVLRVSAASTFELMAAALLAAAKAAAEGGGQPPPPVGVATGFPGSLPGDGWMPEWRGLEARHEMVEVLLGYLEGSGGPVQEGAQELVISACSACSLLVSLPSELGLPVAEARAATTLVVSPLGAGLLVGPVVAGAIYEVEGRYREPTLYAAACLLVTAAATWMQTSLACCSSPAAPPDAEVVAQRADVAEASATAAI